MVTQAEATITLSQDDMFTAEWAIAEALSRAKGTLTELPDPERAVRLERILNALVKAALA